MAAYYNEIDPYAAQWLRNLIAAGHIAPGDVDERSIEDVHPDDLKPYTQCHFFAGIGAWSLALRRASWPDDRPVWTGSCPCQPFSSAGQGAGFDDERHLWPHFHWLIQERRPPVVFGEQVASKDAEPWLDLVSTDLEGLGFAFGAIAFPSAGVGAPHIRDRSYWVADSSSSRSPAGLPAKKGRHQGIAGIADHSGCERASAERRPQTRRLAESGRLAHDDLQQRPSRKSILCTEHEARGRQQGSAKTAGFCGDSGLADLHSNGRNQARECFAETGSDGPVGNDGAIERQPQASPTNGLWRDADWLLCRDGKWRPVRPGTFPLVDGAASRVGRLRAYGNAVNVEAATQFIAAWLEATQ